MCVCECVCVCVCDGVCVCIGWEDVCATAGSDVNVGVISLCEKGDSFVPLLNWVPILCHS